MIDILHGRITHGATFEGISKFRIYHNRCVYIIQRLFKSTDIDVTPTTEDVIISFIRVELYGLAEICDCLAIVLLFTLSCTQNRIINCLSRIELNGLIDVNNCLVKIAFYQVGVAAVVIIIGYSRIEFDGFI